jgi:uncharacterized protein (DUF983 family)
LSRIRADDGPAWLTILLTAHLVVPLSIYVATHDVVPQTVGLTLMLFLTLAISLLILPRSKGLFISVIWLLSQKKIEKARQILWWQK